MTKFETYSLETAPEKSKDVLETVNKNYGFVPNLLGTMAEAPALAEAYLAVGKLFGGTSFSETERQVIALSVSRSNGCEYCVSAHSTIAKMGKVDEAVINAIRDDKTLGDEKLEALRQFATTVVEKRGWLDDRDVEAFLDAGYVRQQVLEVVLGVAMKTMSNYTNHIANTPLDDAFSGTEWRAPESRVA